LTEFIKPSKVDEKSDSSVFENFEVAFQNEDLVNPLEK
jgi:hypothetical protein